MINKLTVEQKRQIILFRHDYPKMPQEKLSILVRNLVSEFQDKLLLIFWQMSVGSLEFIFHN
ncbi:hypothetical protein BpHYR1_052512 [Brachionus plicatilis]|uniref:Uncharacterized protein n=1 Tax=Brachionus plicatilis TaxID=10195 RepID=A0A3M7QX47_BRAPC|nr:hypothetical protein BpHYR1_052512 [Brachionus plicatilis]